MTASSCEWSPTSCRSTAPGRLILLWLGAMIFAGCGPSLSFVPYDLSRLERVSAKDHPKAKTVILKQRRRWLMHLGERYTEHQHHVVSQVLNKDGSASVELAFRQDSDVRHLFARMLRPDGRIEVVDPSRIYTSESHGEKGKGGFRTLTFRFPGVEVGALLEYSFTVRSDGMYGILRERVSETQPIMDYEVALRLHPDIGYKFKVYNGAEKFEKRQVGDFVEFSMHIKNVPAQEDKGWEPNWREYEPWWVYREQFYDHGTFRADGVGSWDDAVRPIGKHLYNPYDKIYRGFEHRLEVGHCNKDRDCIVKAGWAWVRDKVEWSGFESLADVTPLERVARQGHGGSWEKALILWRLLAQEDVQTRFALVTRFGSRPVDQHFPDAAVFNHLVLLLPGEKGAPDRWLDPTCEFCEPGQTGYWLSGRDGLVLHIEQQQGRPTLVPKYRRIDAPVRDEGVFRKVHRLRLNARGDAVVETRYLHTGRSAQWYRRTRREWTPKDWRDDAEKVARSQAPWGRLLASVPAKCDRAKGRCSRRITFSWPGYATPAGDELYVPLSVFRSVWDGWFEDKERKHDIVIWGTRRIEERVEFEAPPGYEVQALPNRDLRHDGLVRCGFSVKQVGRKITVQRSLNVSHGRHSKVVYEEMRAGVRRFADARRLLLVLKRKDVSRFGQSQP